MFTPGEWYTADTGNHQGLIISEETGEYIAVTYDKKNADIVAAAPRILSALKEAVRLYENRGLVAEPIDEDGFPYWGWINEARDAIRKATT